MFVSGPVGTSVTGRGCAERRLGDPVDRVLAARARGRRRQVGAVEAGLAMDMRRRREALARADAARPAATRDVVATKMVEHADRVCGRLLHRLVPGHGGHAQQLDLGAGKREHQRDRVVVARVAVEDDPGHVASISSSSPAIGSEGCAPNREAARAPAAHARLSASPRSRPSSNETTSAAQKASPAAVPSTASTEGGVA